MRPIRLDVTAAGTYYVPVNRYTDDTVITVQVTGLTITSVSWTIDNIRANAGANSYSGVDNAVAAASADWKTIAADADGSYRIGWPIDSVRVILGGTGSGAITVLQDTMTSGG